MKYILSYVTIIVFGAYWLVTTIYISPDNFIRISLITGNETINTFLAQKWEFFAPPPEFNSRLYYTFQSKNDSTILHTYEVMEPLLQLKSTQAPFNSSENILDYVLSSTMQGIMSKLVTFNKRIKYRMEVNEKLILTKKEMIRKGKNFVMETPGFMTLKRYSLYVAKDNNLNIEEYFIYITIAQIDIPKFVYRNKKIDDKDIEANLVFKSDKFKFVYR